MANVIQELAGVLLKGNVTIPALYLGIAMAVLALFLAVRLYRLGAVVALVFMYWRMLGLMRGCGNAVFTAYLLFGAIAAMCAVTGVLLGSNDD